MPNSIRKRMVARRRVLEEGEQPPKSLVKLDSPTQPNGLLHGRSFSVTWRDSGDQSQLETQTVDSSNAPTTIPQ
jgi:hypothetical protein